MRRFRGVPSALAGVALLVLGSLAVLASGAPSVEGATPTLLGSSGLAANATWNGINVSSAGTPGSAFSESYTSTSAIRFHWSAPLVVLAGGVSAARVEMFFFGSEIASRTVSGNSGPGNTSGSIDMPWAAPSELCYLITGTYLVSASLLSSNGTSLWSEGFYVHLSAPYVIGAALPILLLLLLGSELYTVATSGRPVFRPPPAPKKAEPAAAPPPEGGPK